MIQIGDKIIDKKKQTQKENKKYIKKMNKMNQTQKTLMKIKVNYNYL